MSRPNIVARWIKRGVSLRSAGQPEAALAAYQRALEAGDGSLSVWTNIGNAYRDLRRFDESIAAHRQAIRLDPKSGQNFANLAIALRDSGNIRDALSAYNKAIALDPKNKAVRFDRAQVYLSMGDYGRGWPEFEYRWHSKEVRHPKIRQPRWRGQTLADKTLLLWPEQGFGDTILSARFIALARRRVGRLALACRPELVRLFEEMDGIDTIIPFGKAAPEFDVHCPLMGLPEFFASDLSQVPPPAKFKIPEAARRKLMPAFAPAGRRLKLGIVWSGSTTFKNNHLRATNIERFLEFATVPNVQLFSLQKGPRAVDLKNSGADSVVIDLAPYLSDFADTAAAIDMLDLVIMTDSSVAHLAGSIGKPIWNLLATSPYWLYLRDRSDTPWYPSMRLFRQKTPDDWTSVFRDVAEQLRRISFLRARTSARTKQRA